MEIASGASKIVNVDGQMVKMSKLSLHLMQTGCVLSSLHSFCFTDECLPVLYDFGVISFLSFTTIRYGELHI